MPKAFATGELLAPVGGFGANGIKVHAGAVRVSNLDAARWSGSRSAATRSSPRSTRRTG